MARTTNIPEPEIVTEFPKGGREAIYPWEKWTDGKIRVLIRGVHFKGSVKSMRQTVAKHARANGLKPTTRAITKDGKELLYISFSKR